MQKTILFVHQSGPGQFSHLMKAMAADPSEWRPILLRMHGSSSCPPPQGCDLYEYRPCRPNSSSNSTTADVESKLIRGESVVNAMRQIQQRCNLDPSLIIVHPGWGEALFLRDFFPSTPQLHYCEYFYSTHNQDLGFDPEFPASSQDHFKALSKNLNIAYSLLQADALYSPTPWQASTYPKQYQSLIHVIHDGIDLDEIDVYRNHDQARFLNSSSDMWLTYVNRAFEPGRGAHIFCRALPLILKALPKLNVHIIGGSPEQQPYSNHGPASFVQTWLAPLLQGEYGARIVHSPYLARDAYLHALARSHCHVYLTIPFVLSWSLVEAMSLALPIVATDTAPVRDVITHQHNGLLVDYCSPDALADAVIQLLTDREMAMCLALAARERVETHYSLSDISLPRLLALCRSLIRDQ